MRFHLYFIKSWGLGKEKDKKSFLNGYIYTLRKHKILATVFDRASNRSPRNHGFSLQITLGFSVIGLRSDRTLQRMKELTF